MTFTEKIVRKYLIWSCKKKIDWIFVTMDDRMTILNEHDNGTLTKEHCDKLMNNIKFTESKLNLLTAIEKI